MSDYSFTLSTTDPNNYVGLLKFRQGDKNSQVLNVTVTENGKLFKFDGLAVFFNSVLPNGTVVRDKVQTIDYANSKLTYKVIDSFLQEVAAISAWFSFESGDKTVDSTKNFKYIVKAGWQSCITQGNYIYELSEIQREIEEIISNKDFTPLISKIDDLENETTAQLAQKAINHRVDVTEFGAVGDGVTDDTLAIQTALNESVSKKIPLYVPEGMTFLIDGLSLQDVGYFEIHGTGLLKRKPNGSKPLVNLIRCNNFRIPELNTDGNVVNNMANGIMLNEDLHSIRIAECSDFDIGTVNDNNPAGDSVYLKGAYKFKIDTINAKADVDSGRNALSIVKASHGRVQKLSGYNIGVPTMPGGLDIEPNITTDTIEDIKIYQVDIKSAGFTCCAVNNYANAIVRDIEVNGEVYAENSATNAYPFYLYNVDSFKGKITTRQHVSGSIRGAIIRGGFNLDLDLTVIGANVGVVLDGDIVDLKLKGKIEDTTEQGMSFVGKLTNSEIDMHITETAKSGTVSAGPVYVYPTANLVDVVFKGDYHKVTAGYACFRIEGQLTRCRAEGVDMSGWERGRKITGANASSLATLDCPNFNYSEGKPTLDVFKTGTIVWNRSFTSAGTVGWVATADGSDTLRAFGKTDLTTIFTWEPGTIAAGVGIEYEVSLGGADYGFFVQAAAPYSLQGLNCTAYVSNYNKIKVRLQNNTTAPITLPSGSWRVRVTSIN